MNISKNMEAIFLVTVALVIGTGYAQAGANQAAHTAGRSAVAAEPLQTVTVSAKRMSALEKAEFDLTN